MSSIYLFCLSLGFAFTLLSAALGYFAGGDSGHAGPSHGPDFSHSFEAGSGGAHGAGDGDVSDDLHAGSLHLPLLSPTVLSAFVAAFGGSGLLYQHLFPAAGDLIQGALAAGTAAILGLGLAFLIYKITSTLETNRIARPGDALIAAAEVTVSVPADGAGEIAYVSAGTRQTYTARSADGREHRQGTSVRVSRVSEGVAYVVEASGPAAIGPGAGEPSAVGEPLRTRVKS